MEINTLVNHTNIHDSPSAERYYRLQLQQNIPIPPQLQRNPTKAKDLTRDQRLQIRALRQHTDWDYFQIAKKTGFTFAQVQYACHSPLTPQKKRCGRKKTVFSTPEKNRIAYILHNDEIARKLTWADLQWYIGGFELWGEQAFVTAMKNAGWKRKVRPRKIHLTPAHKTARLTWAREQLERRPRPEDWETVLFTDETWATNNPMWKRWFTIHDTEDIEAWA
ncbi:hypothetical protein QBC44DRAFT_334189 [Cladorrhinum sp. PSN332]|nr:hypothetical protein QBC44DRAFT_334189 [Cladorrhinum sp. PSN332]